MAGKYDNKILSVLVLLTVSAFLMILAGCKSTKEMVQDVRIVHDSVFVARDSVVYKLVKDSVIEREQTTSMANGDTVIIYRLREVERWKVRADTVKLVEYVEMKSDSTSHREAVKVEKERKPPNPTPWVLLAVAVCIIIYLIRARLGR